MVNDPYKSQIPLTGRVGSRIVGVAIGMVVCRGMRGIMCRVMCGVMCGVISRTISRLSTVLTPGPAPLLV